MCLAISGKIIEITGDSALIDFGGIKKKANICLVPDLKVGDYVLVHVGFAIQKVDEALAKKEFGLLNEHP